MSQSYEMLSTQPSTQQRPHPPGGGMITRPLPSIDWSKIVKAGDENGERFRRFHMDNTFVLAHLLVLARRWKSKGHSKIGIGMLFEVLRWEHGISRDPKEEFKLNNNYRSYYTRLIQQIAPDVADMFEIRRSKSDE